MALDNGLTHERGGYTPRLVDTGLESNTPKPTNVERIGTAISGGGNNVPGFTITSDGEIITSD